MGLDIKIRNIGIFLVAAALGYCGISGAYQLGYTKGKADRTRLVFEATRVEKDANGEVRRYIIVNDTKFYEERAKDSGLEK